MGQQLKFDLLRLARVLGLFLHDLHNLVASVGAVIGLSVDCDCLLRRAEVLLSVNVNPGPGARKREKNVSRRSETKYN